LEQQVYFENALGLRLAAVLSRPPGERKLPLVVSCHGFGSSKDSAINAFLARYLHDRDVALLRFDFTGHGDSEGLIAQVTISQGVNDLATAIQSVAEHPWIDGSAIGLLGHSYGGAVALAYAARDHRVRSAVLLAPVSDYVLVKHQKMGFDGIAQWRDRGYVIEDTDTGFAPLSYAFYEDAQAHNAYALAGRVEASCLIVHGDGDAAVPVQQSRALAEALGPRARLTIIPGGDHGFGRPGELEEVMAEAAQFLRDGLHEPAPAAGEAGRPR
jgi:dipeptidyl aminopeptidase/acylaminoacyl peptidase